MKKTAITILGILPLALIFLISFFGRAFTPNAYIAVENVEFQNITIPYLKQDKTYQLDYDVYPLKATDKRVSFKSSQESVATVDDYGVVTGISEGYTNISITTVDGNKKAYIGLSVVSVVESVTMEIEGAGEDIGNLLTVGTTLRFKAIVEPASAINKNVTWSTSDNEIASIDPNGNFKALSAGQVTVTVTTEDLKLTDSMTFVIYYDFGDSKFLLLAPEKTFQKNYEITVETGSDLEGKDYEIKWSVSDGSIADITGDGESGNISFKKRGSVTVTAVMIVGSEVYTEEIVMESTFGEIDDFSIEYEENLEAGKTFYVGIKSDPADANLRILNVMVRLGYENNLDVTNELDGFKVSGKDDGEAFLEVYLEGVAEPIVCRIDVQCPPTAIDVKLLKEEKDQLKNFYIGVNQPYDLEYDLIGLGGYKPDPNVEFWFKCGFFAPVLSEDDSISNVVVGSDRHTLTFKKQGVYQVFLKYKDYSTKAELTVTINSGMNIYTQEGLQDGFRNDDPTTVFNILSNMDIVHNTETNVFETSKSITLFGNGYNIDATDIPVIAAHQSQGYNPPAIFMFKGTLTYNANNTIYMSDLTIEGNLFKEKDVTRYYDTYLGIAFFPDEDGYTSGSGNFSKKRYAKATLERISVNKNFRNIYSENIDELELTDITAKYAYACNIIIGGYDKATLTNLNLGFTANASLDITDYFGTKKPATADNPNPKFPETILKGRLDVCNWIGGNEPLFVVETQYAAFISTFAYPYMAYFRYFTPIDTNSGEAPAQKFNYAISFYGANSNMLYDSGVIDLFGKTTGNIKGLINMDDLENKASFGISEPIVGAMSYPSMGIFVIPGADGSIEPEGYIITEIPKGN